ncbi:MAG: cation:proton antiporter [Chlamydiia bacterium]|nr:cation:proton antiporter [Chlamydiia bacterium]
MDAPILRDLLVIFSLSIFVLLLCHRLRIPSVVGFLLTGLMVGPGALGLIEGTEEVEQLSHIGIIFLLFSIGLEFSLKRIVKHFRIFLWGGALQVGLTIILGFLIAYVIGRPTQEAVFLGFLLSLSSTAIVLKILQDKGGASTPQGRASTGILIFQDVVAIPMMLILPMLDEEVTIAWKGGLLFQIAVGLILLAFIFWASINLMPRLFHLVSRTRNRELFLLTVLVACFAIAWITSELGLSLSIGAFLAGLIISDSEYSTEATSDILPFRDLFMSFFFISMGMLSDIKFFFEYPVLLIGVAIGVIFMKSLIAGFSVLATGYPLRVAILSGLTLAQVGEFSFVLAKEGFKLDIGTDFLYQIFLGTSLITMAATPFIIALAPKIADFFMQMPLSDRMKRGLSHVLTKEDFVLKNHVIIVGFGISGQNLAKALKEASIPYIVFEMNIDLVREKKQQGEPILYGDASHLPILQHGGVDNARAIAVLINDPVATLRVVEVARKENPTLYIIGRTRRVDEMEFMAKRGADDVVPDEFGASIEILTRVLRLFQVPMEAIESLVNDFRREAYKNIQPYTGTGNFFGFLAGDPDIPKLETFEVQPGSYVDSKPLKEIDLRRKAHATVVMIQRGGERILDIDPETELKAWDRVTLTASEKGLKKAKGLFKG